MKHKITNLLILSLFAGSVLAQNPTLAYRGQTPQHSSSETGDGQKPSKVTISGYIKDKASGEAMIGATIYIKELKVGASSNLYGFYSLTIPPGTYTVVTSFMGYASSEQTLTLTGNTTINIPLEEKKSEIKEVTVSGKKMGEDIEAPQMSMVKLDAKTIKQIPVLFGEVDVIKAIQLTPGVQSVCDGSTGFSVRGGATDQNLILLDEATVYNASHLMGIFSVFNNDAIREATLYKGDIPAQFGGRLASLLDVRSREGNDQKFKVNGGIGLISSRLAIEGPIIKDRCSFSIAARRSYADVFLKASSDSSINNTTLYFYDINAKLNFKINEHNRVFLSGYFGRDALGFSDAFGFRWGNTTQTIRWNSVINPKLFMNLTALHSEYSYHLGAEQKAFDFAWDSKMIDWSTKLDFNYYLNTSNKLTFGVQSTLHEFVPGIVSGSQKQNGITTSFGIELPRSKALETAAFLSNEQKIGQKFTINYGLRVTAFQNMGTATVYKYDATHTAYDSAKYGSWNVYNTFWGVEPRISSSYVLNETSSLKASYSRTYQFVQQASNSTGGSPLDIWFSASPNTKPQKADQVALGYVKNLKQNMFSFSTEVYYKQMYNQIDFKDNAQLLFNKFLEGETRVGDGWSYGAEFMLRKNAGSFTGWLGYTYSRTWRKIPELNEGNKFPASFDKPHSINLVLNYDVTPRLTVSASWVYSTGVPATFPVGMYTYNNTTTAVYSKKNTERLPDYHRCDFGVTYKSKPSDKRYRWDWNLSIFNIYNRHNAYAIYFEADEKNPKQIKAYRMSLLPILPSVTYNFYF